MEGDTVCGPAVCSRMEPKSSTNTQRIWVETHELPFFVHSTPQCAQVGIAATPPPTAVLHCRTVSDHMGTALAGHHQGNVRQYTKFGTYINVRHQLEARKTMEIFGAHYPRIISACAHNLPRICNILSKAAHTTAPASHSCLGRSFVLLQSVVQGIPRPITVCGRVILTLTCTTWIRTVLVLRPSCRHFPPLVSVPLLSFLHGPNLSGPIGLHNATTQICCLRVRAHKLHHFWHLEFRIC